MRKCNICGRRFRLLAKNRYEIMRVPVGLDCLTEGTTYFNAFDCPYCGCQNIAGVVEKASVIETRESKAITNGIPLPDIAEAMRTLDRSMECILESDHRSFTNPETENGWIFDHIIAWRKMIQPYIKENENA